MGIETSLSLSEVNDRIAILRDNIRQLIEQAAGAAGAEVEERIAERLEQQNAELKKFLKAREAMTGQYPAASRRWRASSFRPAFRRAETIRPPPRIRPYARHSLISAKSSRY